VSQKDLAKKMNTTMADSFAGSSGMAIVNIASPPRQPLQDLYDYIKWAKKIIYLVKAFILF
jgi:hypothetical protein